MDHKVSLPVNYEPIYSIPTKKPVELKAPYEISLRDELGGLSTVNSIYLCKKQAQKWIWLDTKTGKTLGKFTENISKSKEQSIYDANCINELFTVRRKPWPHSFWSLLTPRTSILIRNVFSTQSIFKSYLSKSFKCMKINREIYISQNQENMAEICFKIVKSRVSCTSSENSVQRSSRFSKSQSRLSYQSENWQIQDKFDENVGLIQYLDKRKDNDRIEILFPVSADASDRAGLVMGCIMLAYDQ